MTRQWELNFDYCIIEAPGDSPPSFISIVALLPACGPLFFHIGRGEHHYHVNSAPFLEKSSRENDG